ncbi:hypothetical protein PIB30_032675 [Stylosanthes scabra]|uniref:Uncharacterized protein n=1 Tax=Stylosanthes scabra TaxID=79078 RepID=A0ABU6YAN2_9FABA|nr:hypothetical protein [Stylosanthes scabra]
MRALNHSLANYTAATPLHTSRALAPSALPPSVGSRTTIRSVPVSVVQTFRWHSPLHLEWSLRLWSENLKLKNECLVT